MTGTITEITQADWLAEAERRFGSDPTGWKFVCPCCGHVQSVEDFRKYKDHGATAQSVYQECIGRYLLPKSEIRSALEGSGDGPCDYAAYGLLQFAPFRVQTEGGGVAHSFAFAEV